VQVPALLRAAGLELTTMAEHYGEARSQRVADTEWIKLTAERGWIGFHKDAQIRRNEVERIAVIDSGARMFCVPRADLSAADLAARFTSNIRAIAAAAAAEGPFIYSVQAGKIARLL
jgi:PIN like domain